MYLCTNSLLLDYNLHFGSLLLVKSLIDYYIHYGVIDNCVLMLESVVNEAEGNIFGDRFGVNKLSYVLWFYVFAWIS